MTEKVSVKRLPNCFAPSERTLKIRSALSYLQMFPSERRETLRQFDEKPRCHYPESINGVYDNSISDEDLDAFLTAGDIPYNMADLGNGAAYKDHMIINIPKRATEGAAGFDLQAAIDDDIVINPGQYKLIPTGLSVSMPKDLELQVRPRSGLAAKYGVTVLNAPGTVDSDYGGEIKVILINHGKKPFTISRCDRIAQAVFNIVAIPELHEVDDLKETTRGSGGFGSTGR